MQAARDHYQSHREFGRELSNNNHQTNMGASSAVQNHVVHPILSTKAASGSTGPGGVNNGSNISIFKNFIQQYQSHGIVHSTKNGVLAAHPNSSAPP